VEGFIAVTLVLDPVVGLATSALLLGLLAGGVIWLAQRHTGQACNCFGSLAPSEIGLALAGRNAILAVIALAAAGLGRNLGVEPVPSEGVLVALGVGVVIVLLTEFRDFRMAFVYSGDGRSRD
jgi:hypothetical protein